MAMDKNTIVKKIRALKSNPFSWEEWNKVIDNIYDTKTYQEFRKERHAELKKQDIPYKEILQIISKEWKEYKST